MSDKILYSYTGLFDTPDEIIHAAGKTADEGYKKFDINTPYPVHGMDDAMKLKPSRLGYFALVFGLSGTFATVLLMTWMTAFDYPIVIGGKPFFAFPAFVPIIFEVTVLAASVATVLTMLFVFFKFPNNSHPLHDTDYMKAVTSEKYGISIQAEDELFNEEKVKNFLQALGAKNITPVYFDNEELNVKHAVFEPKFISLLAVVFILVSGATYITLNKLMFITPFNWMMEQSKTIVQESNVLFADGFGMRNPVAGTVPRDQIPYKYKGDPEGAGENLANPLIPSKEVFALGEVKYNTYCSPCHGFHAEGDSRLRGQFPNPPSMHSEKVRNWSDGRLFHVITEGQNIMPAYSSQLSREERWAVVLYIRALQRSLNAKESDLQ
ncbi:MAG: DUF3341 domain-containing protein [Bacteroidetes bacterium]|nr:DUF3341 domain-containing protein [Bacteroidota bacterium]